jgi:AcrR family transcriptional regulator
MNAAVDLFSEIGYPATGLRDIIERAAMTKGAFYYHFESKESLAAAIVEEGGTALHTAFLDICGSSSPALENMIHGLFVVADVFADDKFARTGVQLIRGLAEYNAVAASTYGVWLEEMNTQARKASAEGDLRSDVDPDGVGQVIVGAMLGAELISNVTSGGGDLVRRVIQTWEILLPAIAAEESLPYFREFLRRESLRGPHPPLSLEG